MAITKIISKPAKNHGGLRNNIEYVLKDQKVRDGFVYMTGPSPDTLTWDSVYRSMINEKKLWHKDYGRMCSHTVISFHKDENITYEQALEFGKEFAEKWFSGFQTIIAVHEDRDHVHIHFVTNSVSYEDGRKYHTSKRDLEKMKEITNEMCRERGLTVAEKGKHFDGTSFSLGEITAWTKNKFKLFQDDKKKSYVMECAQAVLEAKDASHSKDEFIHEMGERGWTVHWSDKRKHITFEDKDGKKVRDSNLQKTFNIDISKEVLLNEFARQDAERRDRREKEERLAAEERDLERYYAEIESAVDGSHTETVSGPEESNSGEGFSSEERKTGRSGADTETLIREAESGIDHAEADIDDSRSADRNIRYHENKSVSYEKQSVSREAERRAEEQQRAEAEERAAEARRRHRGRSGFEH
jgi:hypothetical protein